MGDRDRHRREDDPDERNQDPVAAIDVASNEHQREHGGARAEQPPDAECSKCRRRSETDDDARDRDPADQIDRVAIQRLADHDRTAPVKRKANRRHNVRDPGERC